VSLSTIPSTLTRKALLIRHCFGLYDEAREARFERGKEWRGWYVAVSSSAEESRSLTAISAGGKDVLRRRRGLALRALEADDVMAVMGDGVEGIRMAEVEGMGEEGGE